MIQGMGGLMDLTGDPDGEPQRAGVAVADIFTGLYASTAILAALRGRDVSGAGCHIDMALMDVQVAVLANQAMNYLVSGEVPHRIGNGHANIAPYQAFAVADGHVIVAVGNDRQFERLCALLGLAEEARFATNADRVRGREALIALLAPAFAARPQSQLLEALAGAGIPAGPINDLAQVFADPQVIARGMRIQAGDLPGVASPVVIDGKRQVSPIGSPSLPVIGADQAAS
jgi:crotonobetainyl-CoA:carnitine CoA-transferase CaiB-like acyl-CoA transferase